MSAALLERVEKLEGEITLLNQKAVFLLMTCLKHAKEFSAVADILEELVVAVPPHKEEGMMAALADDIAKATRTSPLH